MTKKIIFNKDNIWIYISLFLCFEPKLAVKYPVFNYIYIIGAVIVFVFTSIKYFKFKSISKTFLVLILLRLSFFPQTLLNDGDITMWGYMSIVLLTLCMMFDLYLKKNCVEFIRIIVNVLVSLLIINLLIYFLYPNGLIDGIYFIGIRTRISDIIFPTLAFTLILDYLKQRKYSLKTIVCFIVSILSIFCFSVTTAYIGFLVFFLIFLLLNSNKQIARLLDLRIIVYVGIFISLLFTFFHIYTYFSQFIENLLHKEATLSSRTLIWAEAIKYIESSPFFGHGLVEDGNFVYWGYVGGIKELWQAHNNWLQLLYDGGIFTMLVFIHFINRNHSQLSKCRDKHLIIIFLSTIVAFLIMMISEIYIYTPYFYLIIFAMSNIPLLDLKRKRKSYV